MAPLCAGLAGNHGVFIAISTTRTIVIHCTKLRSLKDANAWSVAAMDARGVIRARMAPSDAAAGGLVGSPLAVHLKEINARTLMNPALHVPSGGRGRIVCAPFCAHGTGQVRDIYCGTFVLILVRPSCFETSLKRWGLRATKLPND